MAEEPRDEATPDLGETQPYVSLYHPDDAPAPPPYRAPRPDPPAPSPYAPSPYAQPYAPPPQAPSPYTAYRPQQPSSRPGYPPPPTTPYTARLPVVAPAAATAPYGVDPMSGMPWSDKSKVTAGLLSLLLPFVGVCGVGRLYAGNIALGLLQLLGFWFGVFTSIFLIGFLITPAVWLWAVIDGVVLLSSGGRDALGRPLRP